MNVIDPVSNLLVSTIATAPDPAATGTFFVVTTGEGALFPDPSTDGEYNLIIYPPGVQITRANSTMVRVTSRTTDTFTVTRDTESSNPRDVVVGDKVAMVISAKMFTDIDTALGTIPTDVADLADSTGVIPTDVADLADSTGVIPIDVSDLSDSTDLIKEDVSELTDTTGLISGKLDKTTNVTAISDTAIAADGEIAVFSLSNRDIETSNVTIATTVGDDGTTVPTSAAVATFVNSKLFTWQGSWATSTAYALYDAVENDGSSYVCTSAHTSGASTEPGVGTSWTDKWDLFVEGIGGNSVQVDSSGGTSDTYGVLSGLVNSSNKVYTVSLGSYISGSLRVYLNGQLQTQGSAEDWTETTPASGTFTFATAPTTGDIIIVMYQFSTGSTGNADTLDGQHAPTGTLVGTTAEQTLTNKTLTSPQLNTPSISNPYKFSAYRSGALNSPNNVLGTIVYNAENFDTNSNFDTSTGGYTAPVDGFYQFNACVSHGTNSLRTLIAIYKGTTELFRGQDISSNNDQGFTVNVSAMVQLSAGDVVYIKVYTASSVALYVGAATANVFSGFLVSTT